ncbi:PorT family protein [Cellulophaga baltica]|uniref:outer membrane beta-barrel protein n=1 Tax=Cellulophaga TaxID=104264 RepID=UPI001C06BE8B|nr:MULTISPECIES: outer membrane beta-barrel protein [Cellulophaga]MBU2998169.1 PorT family protein [Cellulophaga baltica]MDO6769573.1 outer membrane beta-barrel protein [Cellulophaga sp. 1_MG-2023]
MRKTFLTAIFALVSCIAFAQSEQGFGIKAGLNYGATGDYFDAARDAYDDPKGNVGYHVGIFGKIGEEIYLRPELVYTKTKTDYENNSLDMSKLDLPVLIGVKVIGPLNVFAGPAFQYILDTDYSGVTLGDVENDFTVGLNIGAGVNLGKIGIDLRYERGFTENEVTVIDANSGISTIGDRIDTRPDQLILSLSLKI